MAFVLATLGHSRGHGECLVSLLTDEETRDLILDDEKLLHALLEHHGCLRVSTHFYFYVLVRQVFRRSGIEGRAVADYVAEVLAEFSQQEQLRCELPGGGGPADYFFELMAALQTADDRTGVLLRAHIGNQSLFLAGVFPERIRARAERRGAPGLSYYEALGRTNFQMASDHPLARSHGLAPIYATLAERFQTTCRALNDLSERLVNLGEPEPPAHLLA